jgi:dipeptidyl aminopeptidase/acylaminoacyl peptidase
MTFRLLFFCAVICSAQEIVERKPVELPEFAANREIARYATAAEYDEARADAAFRYERVLYRSSGTVVSGYLYAPKSQSGKLPVIVFSRGSLVVNNQAPLMLTMLRRLAREGFLIFAPMYRGSDGMEGRDELGGADLDDLKNAIELVRALPGADVENVFLYGMSRGGMMSYFGVRENWPVRAAAVVGAITDLEAYLKVTDPELKLARSVWPNYDTDKERIHARRSAVRWPEKINKPVLILHGGADPQVSPVHALNLARALTELKSPYSLMIFANDNHNVHVNREKRDRMTAEWFRQHQTPRP